MKKQWNPAHFLDTAALPWGIISPKGKVVDGTQIDDPAVDEHNSLAKTAGFRDLADALNHGWTRFAVYRPYSSQNVLRLLGTMPQPWALGAKHLLAVIKGYPVQQMRVDLLDKYGKRVATAGGVTDKEVEAELRKLMREKNPPFRKGRGTTFRSGTDRSSRAIGAESAGLESAMAAAKRLSTTRQRLEDADTEGLELARWRFEQHHHRTTRGVELVDYRPAGDWDIIIDSLRKGNPLLLTPTHRTQARGNKFNVLVEMTPMEFLRLTTVNDRQIKEIMEEAQPLSVYNKAATAGTNIIPCFLTLDISSGQAKVMGHEGRHRAAALFMNGEEGIGLPVYLRVTDAHPSQAKRMLDKLPGGEKQWMWDTTYLWGWDEIPDMLIGQFNSLVKVPKSRFKVVEPYVQERGRKARGL